MAATLILECHECMRAVIAIRPVAGNYLEKALLGDKCMNTMLSYLYVKDTHM